MIHSNQQKKYHNLDQLIRTIQESILRLTQHQASFVAKTDVKIGQDEEFLVLEIPSWRHTDPIFIRDDSKESRKAGKDEEEYYIRMHGKTHRCERGEMFRHIRKTFPTY